MKIIKTQILWRKTNKQTKTKEKEKKEKNAKRVYESIK